MSQTYTPELKKKIIRLHLEDGRTIKSIVSEFGVSKTTISKWCHEFSEEFRTSPEKKGEFDSMKEVWELRKEIEELKKENLFLKKAAAFFAKEKYYKEFGVR